MTFARFLKDRTTTILRFLIRFFFLLEMADFDDIMDDELCNLLETEQLELFPDDSEIDLNSKSICIVFFVHKFYRS